MPAEFEASIQFLEWLRRNEAPPEDDEWGFPVRLLSAEQLEICAYCASNSWVSQGLDQHWKEERVILTEEGLAVLDTHRKSTAADPSSDDREYGPPDPLIPYESVRS